MTSQYCTALYSALVQSVSLSLHSKELILSLIPETEGLYCFVFWWKRCLLCRYLPGFWKSVCCNVLMLLFYKRLIGQSGSSTANRSRCSLDRWTSKVLWNNRQSADGMLENVPICYMLPSVLFQVRVDNCKPLTMLKKLECQVELLLSLLMKVTIYSSKWYVELYFRNACSCVHVHYLN